MKAGIDFEYATVAQVLHDGAPMSAELLTLLQFCSDYYRHPIGQVVLSALPTRLRSDKPLVAKPPGSYRLSAQGAALVLDTFPKRKVVQRRILATQGVLDRLDRIHQVFGVPVQTVFAGREPTQAALDKQHPRV